MPKRGWACPVTRRELPNTRATETTSQVGGPAGHPPRGCQSRRTAHRRRSAAERARCRGAAAREPSSEARDDRAGLDLDPQARHPPAAREGGGREELRPRAAREALALRQEA